MAKRAEVLEEFPGIQAKEVMKLLGGKWKELSAEDKAVYEAMAKAEKEALAAGADKGACTPLCARERVGSGLSLSALTSLSLFLRNSTNNGVSLLPLGEDKALKREQRGKSVALNVVVSLLLRV
jgi:hypothetical protein